MESEKELEQGEGKGQKERKNPQVDSLLSVESDAELDSRTRETMIPAEIKSQMLNQLRHLGAPALSIFYFLFLFFIF